MEELAMTRSSRDGPGLTNRAFPRPFLLEYLRVWSKNLKLWTGKRATFYGLRRSSKYYLTDLKTVLGLLGEGRITVPIKKVFKLAEIRAAHAAWANSTGMGTIVIDVRG